jgi:hypothetical protein
MHVDFYLKCLGLDFFIDFNEAAYSVCKLTRKTNPGIVSGVMEVLGAGIHETKLSDCISEFNETKIRVLTQTC